MSKIIESISIENYKGFKSSQVLDLADQNSICFLIGQNNSGKSLIARVITLLNSAHTHKSQINLTDNDFHDAIIENSIKIKFEISKEVFLGSKNADLSRISKLDKIILCLEIVKEGEVFSCYSFINDGQYNSHDLSHNIGYDSDYNSNFGDKYDLTKDSIEKSCHVLSNYLKSVFLVFAPIRNFSSTSQTPFNTTGTEIIGWIKNNKDQALIKYAKIKVGEYLKRLNLEAPVDVSTEKESDYLIFTFENHLKLTSNDIGTGYTMIYILLMEIIRSKKKIIIIDEIESHLQPGLIRELIKIIREIGQEQFIIATHSPTVIESAKESDYLYRFQKIEGATFINKFYKNNADAKLLRTVCNDLGIIPGDALLSNCVIWVEGPSDVLWIRAWIKNYLPIYKSNNSMKSNIIEGLHYSILMTGGGLIANISYEEDCMPVDEIDEEYKLKVLRINPNPYVIIDSDNSDSGSEKFKRCITIAEEINSQNKSNGNGIAENINLNNIKNIHNLWLLKGREIENYCHPELLKEFYKKISSHGKSKVKNADKISDWNVYDIANGAGKILTDRGMEGIKEDSGTIKHKSGLAQYIFNNFSEIHFQKEPVDIEKPNTDMIEELTEKLNSLLNYLKKINSLT